jgi:hypothetical protein
VERPSITDAKEKAKLLGLEEKKIIAVDAATEVDADADLEQGETDVLPTDEVIPVKPVDEAVKRMTESLVSVLEGPDKDYLTTGLALFSPKYEAMIENIRLSGGPVLVYSNFKTLEGLGIFAAALRAAREEYMPLKLVRVDGVWEIADIVMTGDNIVKPRYIVYTGDQNAEERRLLLQIYNADLAALPPKLAAQCQELMGPEEVDNRNGTICKIFMITASGAEGISLYNTRQVHIMEPYWNNVRLQQVIGRAIRLCSHADLPWDDRVVDVFTYLSVFTDKQKETGSKTIMSVDKFMSTDQMIFDIATKKQALADGLFLIAQSAAVDCELYHNEHGSVTQCFQFAEGGRPDFMFHPDWRKDLQSVIRYVSEPASGI